MIYKLFSYFIFIVLLFYFFLIFKYFSVKFSCICECIIHGSGRSKSIRGLGNPAEEEKECKSHRDGGHQEKEALKISMTKAPMNSQRVEQQKQSAQVWTRSSACVMVSTWVFPWDSGVCVRVGLRFLCLLLCSCPSVCLSRLIPTC